MNAAAVTCCKKKKMHADVPPAKFSSAAARAVQSFSAKFPTSAKNLHSFCVALEKEVNSPIPDSDSNPNSFLPQYLTGVLIPSIIETSQGLETDDAFLRVDSTSSSIHPNKIINITLSRTLYTLIEMLWLIGLRTSITRLAQYTEPADVNFPSSLVIQSVVLKELQKDCSVQMPLQSIATVIQAIDAVINHDRFAAFMRERHLERVVLTYLVLEAELSEAHHPEIIQQVQQRLQSLLIDTSSVALKSQCVTVLRGVTRCGSQKVKRRSAQYISKILLSTNGLVAIMQGYLDGLVDSPMLSSMQIQLAKSLSTLPADISAEYYLQNLCKQMLSLWAVGLRENDKTLMTTLMFITTRCTQVYPQELLISLFYRPMLQPLVSLVTGDKYEPLPWMEVTEKSVGSESPISETIMLRREIETVLSSRDQVGHALQFLVTFLTLSPPFSFVSSTLEVLHVPMIVTQLFMDAYWHNQTEKYSTGQRSSRSNSYNQVQEWCEDILRRLFTMNPSLVTKVFFHSLDISNSNNDNNLAEMSWNPKGQFRIHSDHSVDIVLAQDKINSNSDYAGINTLKTSISPSPMDNPSTEDILSHIKNDQADRMEQVMTWWKTRSRFAQQVSAWLYLLPHLETYRYEASHLRSPPNSKASSSSSSSSRRQNASDVASSSNANTIVMNLQGSASKCFAAVLGAYFAITGRNDAVSPDSTKAIEEQPSKHMRIAIVMQRCIEELPMDLLLSDGHTILRLLHSIIQSTAENGIDEITNEITTESTASTGVAMNFGREQMKVHPVQELPASSSSSVDLALSLLSSLLLFGPTTRSNAEEEEQLQAMLPSLLLLADTAANPALADVSATQGISQRASDLALTIYKRRLTTPDKNSAEVTSKFQFDSASGVQGLDADLQQFIETVSSSSEKLVRTVDISTVYREAQRLLTRIAQHLMPANNNRIEHEDGQNEEETVAERAFATRQLSQLLQTLPIQWPMDFDTREEGFALIWSLWREAICLDLSLLRDTNSFVYLNAVLSLRRMLSHLVFQSPPSISDSQQQQLDRILRYRLHRQVGAMLIACVTGPELYRQVFASSNAQSSSVSKDTKGSANSSSGTSSGSSPGPFLTAISTTYKNRLPTISTRSDVDPTATLAEASHREFLSEADLQRVTQLLFPRNVSSSVAEVQEEQYRWQAKVAEVLIQLLQNKRGWLVGFEENEKQLLQGLAAAMLRLLNSDRNDNTSISSNNKSPGNKSADATGNAAKIDVFSGRVHLIQEVESSSTDAATLVEKQAAPAASVDSSYLQLSRLYLQQSALLLIGEVLPALGHAGHKYLHDIVHVCVHILRYEPYLRHHTNETNVDGHGLDQDVHIQRARRRAVICLLRGIAEQYVEYLLHVDSVQYVREIAQCLEIVLLQDHDEVVRYQAELTAAILQNNVAVSISL